MPDNFQISKIAAIGATLLLVGVGFVFGQVSPSVVSVGTDTKSLNFASLQETYEILQRKYDGQLDPAKVLEGAKAGLVGSTGDPYTVYLNKEQAQALEDDLSGTLSGIGAEVGIKGGKLTIIAPLSGSPAEAAGLKPGDYVIKVDETDTAGLPLDEAVSKIRGPKDTKVMLKIIRGNGEPFDINITRQVINVSSVKSSLKNGNIGHIQLTRFADDSGEKVAEAARSLKAQGATKFILDMRNNPGGYLASSVDVSSQFLPAGKLIVEEKHGQKVRESLKSQKGGELIGVSLVVLINEGSASASEIVAGALQDHRAAKLIGEKTFGKGSVQEIIKIPGGELKITVARWYTPKGRNIDKEGIKPDIKVKQTQADFDASRDPQLERALQELK
ncbi:MAG TPA: S41 family peptidase [Candidatus Dormibacteraeota bacterium]|nr:S41 family peptidase [Candidatus Dormibacteraeota bacterium]